MLPKRQWSEMTWQDFSAPDTARWIAVLPLAATEQHGPHLPLGVDRLIAEAYLSGALALMPDDLPVTVLPVQAIGQSDEHLRFPGTLSFSAETVIRAWTEIGESVHRAGVRKLVLVSGHGGNLAGMDMVARDLRAFHGSGLELPTDFQVYDVVRDYAEVARSRGGDVPDEFDAALARAGEIVAAVRDHPEHRTSPNHNDLLAAMKNAYGVEGNTFGKAKFSQGALAGII